MLKIPVSRSIIRVTSNTTNNEGSKCRGSCNAELNVVTAAFAMSLELPCFR